MTREEVFALICSERVYQEHWDNKRKADPKGVSHPHQLDADKPVESWICWMEQYLLDAREAIKFLDKKVALEAIRKVTALGFGCMEFNETPSRSFPDNCKASVLKVKAPRYNGRGDGTIRGHIIGCACDGCESS